MPVADAERLLPARRAVAHASRSARSTRTPTARSSARASAWSCSSDRPTPSATATASTRSSRASASRATAAASSVMAPRVEGEELALRRAYEAAGRRRRATRRPDRGARHRRRRSATSSRSQALTRVFGERDGELPRCALGHRQVDDQPHDPGRRASPGVIKTALALHHRVLPPTLNCDEPNPKLELEKTPFYLNTETRPWIHGGREPRRAGVNAFGFGGINAHAVLEECRPAAVRDRSSHLPAVGDARSACSGRSRPPSLSTRRGGCGRSPRRARPAFALADLAYTLNRASSSARRAPVRLAMVAESLADLRGEARPRGREARAARRAGASRTSRGIYFAAEPLGRDGKVVFCSRARARSTRTCWPTSACTSPRCARCFDRIDRVYVDHPRGYVPATGSSRGPRSPTRSGARAEERLMQMDVAVEAVLTANRGHARGSCGGSASAPTRASATAPASTRRPRRRASSTDRHRGALSAFCARPAPLLLEAASRDDGAAGRAAGGRRRPRAGRGGRARGRRRAVRGDGQLPAPGRARRRARRRSSARASSPCAKG